MAIRHTTFASTLALLGIATAHADGLQPVEGRVIDLGSVTGVVYYTPEPDGYRVVATFAQEEAGTPMRFEAVLAPGQSVVLSAPRDVGVAPRAVEISRHGDQVLLQEANVSN
jgi:hypothetical protein